ncbi:hypothetical protein BO71DRAFT_400579 [Aspergillus ellipticus CBS 707.79]|uniref:Uncharacterized protein n=1 Tax=Aspergillus ellipticus CBS 707.79 TaxID=1448320 RepID=A0A319DM99_9EURO|nr:hypothetical protein BO71DRAFT_400579 [Aspergillus ellipticus CBS 707.79]
MRLTALLTVLSLSATPALAALKTDTNQCAAIPADDVIVKPLCNEELQASYREHLCDNLQRDLDKAFLEERERQNSPSFYGIPIPSFATSLYERLTHDPNEYDICPVIRGTVSGLRYEYTPAKNFACCLRNVRGTIERAVKHFIIDNEADFKDYASVRMGTFDPEGRMEGSLKAWKEWKETKPNDEL